MNADFVRYIDSIHRDKGIEAEVLFLAFEDALVSAIKKRYDIEEDFAIHFDRENGTMESDYEINFEELGRIFAQTVKQSWFTKIKEAERDVMFDEYEEKIGDIITGHIQRFEGDSVIVQLGRVEGILPRSEKVRGESYHVGERIRALVLDVKKIGLKVRVVLSRGSTGLVRRLFELEVPEIADEIIEIRKLEREPGYRTKISVSSSDARVDCVGACVGVRGTRIKSIIDELGGERIDIIRWNEDPTQMLINALQPAEVSHIQLDDDLNKALVLVEEDQLSLAIGRKGQNVRLAAKLCGWEIDIMTRAELEETLKNEEAAEKTPAAADDRTTEVTATEVTATEVTATEVTATEVTATEVTATEVTATETAAAENAESATSDEPAPTASDSETATAMVDTAGPAVEDPAVEDPEKSAEEAEGKEES